jgi:hypothetical protein
MLTESKLSDEDIDSLKSAEYCKRVLGVNYPVLKIVLPDENLHDLRKDYKDRYRYYQNPITASGVTFLLTKEWYASQRASLESWLSTRGYTK